MTLTVKRQTVFPLDWCKRHGLEKGGPVNVFEAPDGSLLIRPVRPPSPEEFAQARRKAGPLRRPPPNYKQIVEEALREVRAAK